MSEHLSATVVNAVVDGELDGAELAQANEHLATCLACSSQALSLSVLKRRVANAARRYELPRNFAQRMGHVASGAPSRRRNWTSWVATAALLAVCIGALVMQRVSRERVEKTALVDEVFDQHIATLAANAPPEVISSDRHTVKPWFQGKLPFSFNLPAALPPGMTLDGANLTYLGGQPVAQLLFSIGKHRASVFIEQSSGTAAVSAGRRAGFQIVAFRTAELQAVAVSDAEPVRVSELVSVLRNAQ